MTGNSFTQKIIQITMTLGDGAVFSEGSNTKILTDLRMTVNIRKMGHPAKNGARVKIYGMSQNDMNACTVVPNSPTPAKHPPSKKVFLMVEAGDASGLSTAFKGEISEAYASYQSPPNMYFNIEAMTGYYPVRLPARPRGYQGSVKAEDIIRDIANSIGYGFWNNGFSAILDGPYLTGSPIEQIRQVAAAVQMEIQIDDMAVYIAPLNTPRASTKSAPVLSAATGMKEYPVFDKHGLRVDTIYNPGIIQGGQVYLQSDIQAANGYFIVDSVSHQLESLNPHGKWISTVHGHKIGQRSPVVTDVGGI